MLVDVRIQDRRQVVSAIKACGAKYIDTTAQTHNYAASGYIVAWHYKRNILAVYGDIPRKAITILGELEYTVYDTVTLNAKPNKARHAAIAKIIAEYTGDIAINYEESTTGRQWAWLQLSKHSRRLSFAPLMRKLRKIMPKDSIYYDYNKFKF